MSLLPGQGPIACRLREPEHPDHRAVLWVFGAGGGFHGPAGGLYDRLGAQLAAEGITLLQVSYRQPGALVPCVLDVLAGVALLEQQGVDRVALVGHSFGGAVVIQAGLQSKRVAGVAALSSQSAGAGPVGDLSPRPVLFLHGTADEVLPDRCSRSLYAQAREPKAIKLHPGCRHGLDPCVEELDRDLLQWLRQVALPVAA